MNNAASFKQGVFFALAAYTMWGILPLYWALIKGIDATEILMFRIVLSLLFMAILVPLTKQGAQLKSDLQQFIKAPKKLFIIIVAGYVVTLNWGTFIYAINANYVLQTSLG